MSIVFGIVFAGTALCHRSLSSWAPSNRLIRRLRHEAPPMAAAAALVALGITMVALAHVVQVALSGRAGPLYAAVLVLAWDGLKLIVAGVATGLQRAALGVRRQVRRGSELGRARSAAESAPTVDDGGVQPLM